MMSSEIVLMQGEEYACSLYERCGEEMERFFDDEQQSG